ncbi:MAG: type II CAAX prenyl endopeptidase Rce1 family protein [Spirochaetia bacterium]
MNGSSRKKYGLIIFFPLAFIISWLLWLPRMINPENGLFQIIAIAGSFGPSMAGLTTKRITEGKAGVRDLLRQTVNFKFSAGMYGFILLFGPLLYGMIFLLSSFVMGYSFDSMFLNDPGMIIPGFFYILIAGGPLGEELGWRGTAQPAAERLLSPILTSLFIGIFWSLWHLPLFLTPGTVQSLIPFWQYFLQTVMFAFLYTRIYHRTGGSVFAAILFHGVMNFSIGLFPVFQHFLPAFLSFSGLSLTAAALVLLDRDSFSRQLNT